MAQQITGPDKPTSGANPYIDSLVTDGRWTDTDGGTVTLNYNLRDSDTHPTNLYGENWALTETAAVQRALAVWQSVANISFVETDAASADLNLWLITPDDFENKLGLFGSTLGYSEFPTHADGALDLWFNNQGDGWSVAGGLDAGGYAFVTLVHELGHALGLAHPHDGYADGVDPSKFPGVNSPGDKGDFDLNQGIFTMMSYNDGWQSKFSSHTPVAGKFGFGWQASAMALDIAAIQAIYGANTTTAAGDTVYSLPAANDVGAAWNCIWDTGGIDTISAATATAGSLIYLCDATLVGPDAGGTPSYVKDIVGGYTIANSVVIENATGSAFGDHLTGNESDNVLLGSGGNDVLRGMGGIDTLDGGEGSDSASYYFESGVSIALDNGFAASGAAAGDTLNSIENLSGSESSGDVLSGNDSTNILRGNGGGDILAGLGGSDVLAGGSGNDSLRGGAGGDALDGGTGFDRASYYFDGTVVAALDNPLANLGAALGDTYANIENLAGSNLGNDRLYGDVAANSLYGYGGNDRLVGRVGNDTLIGGTGADFLDGGAGVDRFQFDSAAEGGDTISYFSNADYIVFKSGVFSGLTTASFSAGNLVSRTDNAAQDNNDYFIFCTTDRTLWFDVDGNGVMQATLMATLGNIDGAVGAGDILFV